jgi:putative endonuclease
VVEGARLESVYTATYRGFESLPLCKTRQMAGFLFDPSINTLLKTLLLCQFCSTMDTLTNQRFYVYILQSKKDFSYYIGQCDNLDKRMSKHSDGLSKYTSGKRPLRLVYFESYATRSESIKRERQIKCMKSNQYLNRLISNWLLDPGG